MRRVRALSPCPLVPRIPGERGWSSRLPAFLFVLALLAASPAFGQDAPADAAPHSFTAAATPDRVRLGEAFTYKIEIRDDPAVRYDPPKTIDLGKSFEVSDVKVEREKDGDAQVTRILVQARMFELGEQRISDLELAAQTPSGAARLVVTGPAVTGEGLLAEDAQPELKDIMPPVELPVRSYALLAWAAGALAAAALAFAAWRLWRRRRLRAGRALPTILIPADQRALEALAALQKEDLPGQGRAREFHFRLSEIVRAYLGERFALAALDMTTEELLAALGRTHTPGLDYARFEAFCREGDLVKYAKAPAAPAECKAAIEAAFGFVHATRPAASPPGADRKIGGPGGEGAVA